MEGDIILVQPTKMTRPVKVDHLQSCSQIFRSDQTEMDHFIWSTNRNFWNFGLNGNKAPLDSSLRRILRFTPRLHTAYLPNYFQLFLLKFCHTLLTNLTKFGLVYLINKAKNSWKQKSLWSSNLANCVNCSVFTYFQNILRGSRKYPYPHHGGNWKFGGGREVRGPRNSRGEGGWMIKITFPRSQFQTQYENCYLLIW